MTVKKISASDKRFNALKAFGEKYRPASNGYRLIESATADDMIADIEAMKPLGRTDRWKDTLTGWQAMIRDCEHNCESTYSHIDWASLQGSVYAGYAAD